MSRESFGVSGFRIFRYNCFMQLPLGFGHLDFEDWARGVVSAFITGGAGAVTSAFSVTAIDSDHFPAGGLKFFEVAAMVFCVTGFMNMMAFLRTKPLPDIKTVVKTVEVTAAAGTAPKVVTTFQETSTQPVVDSGEGKTA